MNELGHGTGPFGELCREATRNGIYKPADQVGDTGNTRYFRMGDLFAIDKIDSSVAPTLMTELSDAELDKHRVQGGDLLFCRTSVAAEGVGKCSIVRDASSPLVPASNLIRVRVDPDKVDPCFAYYYFRSAAGSKQLRNMVRGAAVFTITGGDIGLDTYTCVQYISGVTHVRRRGSV